MPALDDGFTLEIKKGESDQLAKVNVSLSINVASFNWKLRFESESENSLK
jgi:hypothetical protein